MLGEDGKSSVLSLHCVGVPVAFRSIVGLVTLAANVLYVYLEQ